MQLKLLNLYKFFSNIATNLVGAFIPVIVYDVTGVISYAILSIILQYLFYTVGNITLKKWYYTKPQVCLLFRIIPIALYSAFIIIMDYNVWVGIVGACVFYGISESLRSLPPDIIYNYVSGGEQGEKGLGLSRLFEQLGVIAALIVGGYVLDINKFLITIVALVIYIISVIPLVMFYVKCKGQKSFNKDFTSNAYIHMNKSVDGKNKCSKLAKRLLFSYALVYLVFSCADALVNAFTLFVAISASASYALVGMLNALYNALYGLGSYLFDKFNSKHDGTIAVSTACIIIAICCGVVGFVRSDIWLYVIFAVCGFFYSFIPIFVLERLFSKSRIMGVGNNALYYCDNYANTSVILAMSCGFFGSMIPVFFAFAIAMVISAGLIPYNEENTRSKLVNYLQHNEIIQRRRRTRSLKLRSSKKINKT